MNILILAKLFNMMEFNVLHLLEEMEKLDLDPRTGKLFAYVYEAGDEGLKKVAKEALVKFAEKKSSGFHCV